MESRQTQSWPTRVMNPQLNAALHGIALTPAHYRPEAREFIRRRRASGHKTESIRALERRFSDVVHRALHADAAASRPAFTGATAPVRRDLETVADHAARWNAPLPSWV